MELANLVTEVHEEVPVLVVEGEIDASNAPELAAELRSMLSNFSFALVVDISGATYMDSAALNTLAVLHNELKTRQQKLHIVAPPDSRIHRLLKITRLDSVLGLHETLPDAVETARAHG